MRAFLSFVLLDLGLFAGAKTDTSPYILHEKRTHLPTGWTLKCRHDPSTTLPLRFALTQSNIDDIGKYLMDSGVAPSVPEIRETLVADDVLEMFAHRNETIEAARSWLLERGVESNRIRLTSNKGWIQVTSTVEETVQPL